MDSTVDGTGPRHPVLVTTILSSHACRGLVTDDESLLDANDDAFHVLHTPSRRPRCGAGV